MTDILAYFGGADGRALLDVVRTVAVLATPITLYLGFRQVRASARATQGRTYFDTIGLGKQLTDAATELLLNPDLSEGDQRRFRIKRLCISVLDFYENIFYQRKIGNFPEERWPSWENYIAKMMNFPELAEVYQDEKLSKTLSDDFVKWMDELTSHKQVNTPSGD
jgi:hypothetical protein